MPLEMCRKSYRRLLCLVLCLSFFVLPAGSVLTQVQAQGARKPITHDLMWLMKRVGAPAPSPDGRWVVFNVTEPAYDEKEQVSDLWVVPADGSAKPRRLTSTKGGESGIAWNPDSRRVAFSAKREGDEANQIYVINVAEGGEAVRLTSVSTGARSPVWRPDGKALLFSSSVFPNAADDEANKKIAAERKAQKYKARVYETFPIRRWDKWLEDTQTHLFVQTLEPQGKAKDILAGTNLVRERGFAGRATDSADELDAAWSPDGNSVVFVATTKGNTAAYASVNTHLYRIPATGGEPLQLTNGQDNYASPRFSPDGKRLYSLIEKHTGKVYNIDRIAMFSWPTLNEPTVVTAGFDRSIGAYAFTPDSKNIYLLAEDAGHEKLYTVAATGGEVRLVFDMTQGVYTGLRIPDKASSTMLFASWESAVSPSEVVRIDPAAKRHRALTEFNAERVAQIDWQPLREFWFTSKGGKRIHNMIALPPNFDENKKYPLFVLIHGGPHSMWRDSITYRWNYHLLAQPGYIVLMTDYTGSTGYGEKFAQDIQGDPFITPANEINEAADEAIRLYKFIDASRQAAGGASYGGHLANWLQATTTRYKCLISHAGLINLESQWGTSDGIYHREVGSGGPVWEQGAVWREQNPIRFAKNFRTPILLSVGENDFRVPLNQTLENWSVLQRLRVPSRLVVWPEENHWILKAENSRYFYKEVHDWLKKYLG